MIAQTINRVLRRGQRNGWVKRKQMPCEKHVYVMVNRQQHIYDSQTLRGYIHEGVGSSFALDKRITRSLCIRAEVDMVLLKR